MGEAENNESAAGTETLLGAAAAAGDQPAAGAPAAASTPPAGEAPKGTEAAKPEGDAAKGDGPPADAPPALDLGALKVPDGFTFDDRSKDQIKTLAEQFKLDSAGAQKLVDAHVASLSLLVDQHKATIADWRKGVETDPDLGGAKLQETMSYANKALRQFGTPELLRELENSGYGSHKAFVRLLSQVGRLVASDSTTPAADGDPGAKPKDLAELMFGTS